MLEINTLTEVQPDAPADIPSTEEHNTSVSVPSELWMASEMTEIQKSPEMSVVERYQHEQEQIESSQQQELELRLQDKKKFVPRITEEDAIRARGFVASEQKNQRLNLSPCFRTYGREYETAEMKMNKVGLLDIGGIPDKSFTEPRHPSLRLPDNQCGVKQKEKVCEEPDNLQQTNEILNYTIFHKSILQKCENCNKPSECFVTPSRDELVPNIVKMTQNESINKEYRKTPRRTDDRAPEDEYVGNANAAAEMCRTTLLQQGDMAKESPLKGQIYPRKCQTEQRNRAQESWYMTTAEIDILQEFERRQQLAVENDRKVHDLDEVKEEQEEYSIEFFEKARDKMADKVVEDYEERSRTQSPWRQWALPEKVEGEQEQELQEQNKKVDAVKQKQQNQIEQQKQAARAKQQESAYYKQLSANEEYRKKKMGQYYYPQSQQLQGRSSSQKTFKNFTKADEKFDLLKENKYINENLERPLDMHKVAVLKQQLKNEENLTEQTVNSEYEKELRKQHRGLSSKSCRVAVEESLSSRTGKSKQDELVIHSMAKQTSRHDYCGQRNYVNLTKTENFLMVDKLVDRDIEEAEEQKYLIAGQLEGLTKNAKGRVLTDVENEMLMENMNKRLKMVENQQGERTPENCKILVSVNDLKPCAKSQVYFGRQCSRTAPENSGMKNLLITVTDRERRARDENANLDLSLEEQSRQKVDEMAVQLEQGGDISQFKPQLVNQRLEEYEQQIENDEEELQERMNKEKQQFYAESNHPSNFVPIFAKSGRDVLSNKFVAETTTNLQVGTSTLLKENGNKLIMNEMNQNYFDYEELINATPIYNKLHSQKTIVADLNGSIRNDHARLAAEAEFKGVDLTYQTKNMDEIFGKGDKGIGFNEQSNRVAENMHSNDLFYDCKYGAVEERVCDLVKIEKQNGRK